MTEHNEILSEEQIKIWTDLSMVEDFAKTTLEFLFTQRYTNQAINEEVKYLMNDWPKQKIFMFWHMVKKTLTDRLQVLINSIKPYGLGKKPEDLFGDILDDVPELSLNDQDKLDDRFQNIPEKTLRREIERMIEENRYEDLMLIQDRVFFRVCCQSLNKFMEDEKRLPQLYGNKYGLEHNLAFFRILIEYQNSMSEGQELETEVIVKKKGT